jgi:hypothetical protein
MSNKIQIVFWVILVVLIFIMVLTLIFRVQVDSPDGFIVYSKGDHSNRELKLQRLAKGKGPIGEEVTVTPRGNYSDIQCCISFDGKFVAFSRELELIDSRYDPPGDYHMFGNYDVYIVRIDGDLPAEPKKVAHGYWPSWGDDSDQSSKTLYYSHVPGTGREDEDLKIFKVTIGSDGSISVPVQHIDVPENSKDPHMQCSPDGRYVAYRTNKVKIYDSKTGITSGPYEGCHPSWGSDSYWLYWARSQVGAVVDGAMDGSILELPFPYYCGWSNDMKWVIGRIDSIKNDQNTPHELQVHSVELSKIGEPVNASNQFQFKMPKGTWCDIHVTTGTAGEQ